MCHNRTLSVGLLVPAAVGLGLAAAATLLFVAACTQTNAQTLTLAEGYARGFTLLESRLFSGLKSINVPPDQTESQWYYTLAADLGDKKALRHVFEEYHFGGTIPKNDAIAERYLNKAAQFGSEWAILLLAQGQEKLAPGKALEAYLRLARNDNCVAQLRLAQAYASGVLVKTNLTQAYFWLLLAKVNEFTRKAGKRGKFPGERRWIYAGAGRMRLARGGIFGPGMPRRAPMNS
jgi:TPR repeat protein